jgi:6-phosphogluconate dehydrogenase
VKEGNAEVPCCDWVGQEGAGHFVKMVHNGIEYGDIQLICEAYHLLSGLLGMKPAELSQVFGKWNTGALDSYLIEITRDILGYIDPETGKPMVDLILDTAGQKGTGKWTVTSALDLGVPLTLIGEAVFSRCLSAQKDERVAASQILSGPSPSFTGDKQQLIDDVEMALYASKIMSYAQGFALMRAMAKDSGWTINNGGVALMWRGGCIIRSVFLGKIKEAFDRNADLANLLVDPYFAAEVGRAQAGWRRVLAAGIAAGIPMPAMTSALSYYDGYRAGRLSANLLQAQRDYFGAHTYERTDKPRGQFFHTNWTGRGGTTASTTYNV